MLVGGEDTYSCLSDVEVDELVRLVRDEATEIPANEAMPSDIRENEIVRKQLIIG